MDNIDKLEDSLSHFRFYEANPISPTITSTYLIALTEVVLSLVRGRQVSTAEAVIPETARERGLEDELKDSLESGVILSRELEIANGTILYLEGKNEKLGKLVTEARLRVVELLMEIDSITDEKH